MKLNRAVFLAIAGTFVTTAAAPQLLPPAAAETGTWKCTVVYGFPIGISKGYFAYCHLVTPLRESVTTSIKVDPGCRVHADADRDGSLYELEVKKGTIIGPGVEVTGWCDAPTLNGKTAITLKDTKPPKKPR